MTDEWLLIGLGVLLTLGTAVFVAAEFSLITVDRLAVERAAETGDGRARLVLTSLRSLSTQLSGAQVGITLTTLLVGFLVEPSVAALLEGPLTRVLPDDFVGPVSVAVALLLATGVSMVVGELVPKNLALSLPLATARVAAPLQLGFVIATRPLITLLNGTANRLLHLVGVEAAEELSSGRAPEELVAVVRRSARVGTLDQGVADLLTRSLRLAERTAADVMTPRVRMQVLHAGDHASDVVELARRTGHSRFPVLGRDVDDVTGVVHVKKAVAVPHQRRLEVPVSQLAAPALRVPETARLDRLLVDLRDQGLQLAVVLDEYGGTAGVVTLEDVVEEIVGEVSDEHDRAVAGLRRMRDGTWLLPGLLRPDELRDRLPVEVPEDGAYETLGGFVMARLGRVPQSGDEVVVPGGLLRVQRMEGRRVDVLRFRPLEGEGSERSERSDAAQERSRVRHAPSGGGR